MKILCLGGAGKICSEAVRDLAEFSDASRITIADINTEEGQALAASIDDPRVSFVPMDLCDRPAAIAGMQPYDLVVDGTTIRLNELSTALIAEAGCHGINLNGFGAEYAFDDRFKANGKVHVPGFGMTPGITDMMVKYAADRLETVDTVRISHGAFRPIAFSGAITETTIYEYREDLPGRVVFENGRFLTVPPFARERMIKLPEPYGTHPQWIIPHAETRTAYEYLKDKGVRLIEVRGTWPPKNMRLIKALYEWGFFRNDPIGLNGTTFGIMNAIGAYLLQAEEGRETELYGYALHVEVSGTAKGRPRIHTLTHTHPASDGSVSGWEKLRAYTRCVGIPMAIGAMLILNGSVPTTGVVMPEFAFNPVEVFQALSERGIHIHEQIEDAASR